MSLGGGALGGGGFGANIPNQEATASMDGDSTVAADASFNVSVAAAGDSSMSADASFAVGVTSDGDSSVSADAILIVSADVQMSGDSDMTAEVIFQVTAALVGSSSVTANPVAAYAASSSMGGSATFGASANLSVVQITAAFQGGSELAGDATFLGAYGEDSYGGSPYGGKFPPYGLESAEAITSTQLRVRYTAMFDTSYPPLVQVSNYSVFPSLNIYSITIESAQSVLLTTDPMNLGAYTLTIATAQGYFGQPLDPDLDEVSFVGIPAFPSFFAVATRKTRVRLVFSEPMLQNAALLDPASYSLTDLSGNLVSVTSVTAEQITDVMSVILTLGEDLVDERQYVVTVLNTVVTVTLNSLNPNTSMFQWVENTLTTQVPVHSFSGELIGGLLGNHAGLVFFSPALENSAADSIIQVEEVDVCTKAFDEYHFPQPIDPPVLMTHGAGVVPTPTTTTLNSTCVLWAPFPRLAEAKFELEMGLEETVPAPTDTLYEVSLTETWPSARVAILNNTGWKLFDNAGTPPEYFITADNLTPFEKTITIVNLSWSGESSADPEATVTP